MAREARDPARLVLRSATAVRFASYQRRAVRAADRVWFVSPRELDRMAYARGKARLVPNGATADLFTIPPLHGDRPVATFVGPASYDANRRAVEQLLGRIWPLVSRRVPGAELRLVGNGWRQVARTHPDVIDRGFVPDLSAELRAATIALAPLRSGAGTKIKVLEAMAAARPVVATRIAAEGIPPSPGLRVEDDPGAFADAAASWLTQPDTARAAGEANRTAVRGQEWSAIWAEAIVELEQLVQRPSDGASADR
jgi:glycosyltransferase involved in cell wall biosynthesis